MAKNPSQSVIVKSYSNIFKNYSIKDFSSFSASDVYKMSNHFEWRRIKIFKLCLSNEALKGFTPLNFQNIYRVRKALSSWKYPTEILHLYVLRDPEAINATFYDIALESDSF